MVADVKESYQEFAGETLIDGMYRTVTSNDPDKFNVFVTGLEKSLEK